MISALRSLGTFRRRNAAPSTSARTGNGTPSTRPTSSVASSSDDATIASGRPAQSSRFLAARASRSNSAVASSPAGRRTAMTGAPCDGSRNATIRPSGTAGSERLGNRWAGRSGASRCPDGDCWTAMPTSFPDAASAGYRLAQPLLHVADGLVQPVARALVIVDRQEHLHPVVLLAHALARPL